jgi:very-short-patch-repair endonuclease
VVDACSAPIVLLDFMPTQGKVLVAILNNRHDFNVAYEQNWYRIPVSSVKKLLKHRWPPQWLAFYQTKIFGQEAHAINYFAQVIDIHKVYRWQLFPHESHNAKSSRRYYKLILQPLQRLPKPIFSRRLRRIVFIPTTVEKFFNAVEINDLYDESPLEDKLWAALKRLRIQAERQELIETSGRRYMLDFAIYCGNGNIDVETDGDTYHANSEKSAEDNVRNNDLEAAGWKVLRFNTIQIQEQMAQYCVPNIVKTINSLGGIDEGGLIPRKIDLDAPQGSRQLGLFDNL